MTMPWSQRSVLGAARRPQDNRRTSKRPRLVDVKDVDEVWQELRGEDCAGFVKCLASSACREFQEQMMAVALVSRQLAGVEGVEFAGLAR